MGGVLPTPAYARIKRIDVSKVETMDAVVVTFDDIPDVLSNESLSPSTQSSK